jgi:hypothetical protein
MCVCVWGWRGKMSVCGGCVEGGGEVDVHTRVEHVHVPASHEATSTPTSPPQATNPQSSVVVQVKPA